MKRLSGYPTRFLFACFALASLTITGFGQSTRFLYQGSLKNGAAAASGDHDFEFLLFDELVAGSQVGAIAAFTNVAVVDGIFSVHLDFGTQFNGLPRFLEIRVRQTGQGAFTTLSPRQPILTVPYAIRSSSSSDASKLGGIAANQYVLTTDPRMSDARPPTPGSSNYIQNSETLTSGYFNISGDGTAETLRARTSFAINFQRVLSVAGGNNLFVGMFTGAMNQGGAYNTFVGTGAGGQNVDGGLNSFFGSGAGGTNVSGGGNSFFGYNSGVFTKASSNSFFGASSGQQNQTGQANSFFGTQAGFYNTSGANNAFFGFKAGEENTTSSGNSFFGAQSRSSDGVENATAIGFRAQVSLSNSLVLGSVNGINGATVTTNVGIGTTSPQSRLHVIGNSLFTNGSGSTTRGLLNLLSSSGPANFYMQGAGQDKGIRFGVDSSTIPNSRFSISHQDSASAQERFSVESDGSVRANGFTVKSDGSVRSNGPVYVADPSGMILKSPNGACWGVTVGNDGALSTTAVPCP